MTINLDLTTAFLIIDVGAMNGFKILKQLHPYIHLIGFEPDPKEHKRLRDSIYPQSKFKSWKAEQLALSNESGTKDFYFTSNPEMNSLLEIDTENFSMLFGRMPGSAHWKQHMLPKEKGQASVIRLDDYSNENGIKAIDFLKLDAQGKEKDILSGAIDLLRLHAISIIQTELILLPFYKSQNTFSSIDVLLNQHGYMMIDCTFNPQSVNDIGETELYSGDGIKEKLRQFPVGDAVYIKSPKLLSPQQRYRAAIILASMAYAGATLSMLSYENQYNQKEAMAIIKKWIPVKKYESLKHILKNIVPPFIFKMLK
jgi:FkbM family methyltransferase